MNDNPRTSELGLFELIAIGVGGMIGGGIFSILGLAVDISGHAAPLAFLVGSIIASIAGYSYVKLALAFHSDGASFTYLENAYPDTPSFAGIAGWAVIVGYVGTLALYAFTFGAYSAHLFGVESSTIARWVLSSGCLVFFLFINMAGAGKMGKAEDFAVFIKLLLLAILAVVGFFTIESTNLQPLFDHGASSVILGGAVIFVAFEGFQLITNAVCEVENPEKNIPRGLYGSLVITSVIYICIAFVSVGNLDTAAIHSAQEYALAVVAEPILGKVGVILVDIAAILATSSAINATIFGASHMAYEISKENMAPRAFSFRNRSGVPLTAALVITGLAVLLSGLGGLEMIASFSSLTFLLVSIAVCVANLKLRSKTRSAVVPVIAGILLTLSAVATLVLYLAENDKSSLYFSLFVYGLVVVIFLLFEKYSAGSAQESG